MVLLIVTCLKFSCQPEDTKINLMVLVDDKLEVGTLTNVRIKIKDAINGDVSLHDVSYYPGNLSISKPLLSKLKDSNAETFYLLMTHNEFCGQEEDHIIHNYEVQLYQKWIDFPYVIFRFYNMNKQRNRLRFDPIEGENYTFEYQLPNYYMNRNRKIPNKNDCN